MFWYFLSHPDSIHFTGDKADPVPSNLIGEHHKSPNKGSFWTNDTITFDKIQLTNSANPKQNQIMLNRFHKYQPIINISKIELSKTVKVKSVTFSQLQFIATPHYYNKEISVLKTRYIDKNH